MRESGISETSGDQVPRIYPVGSDQKSKQLQNGVYDSSILCAECDGNLIGPWDNYGQKLLMNQINTIENSAKDIDASSFYKIDSFDYKKLKLFFMSILWRASITDHPFFTEVKLGCWEENLKTMIQTQNPGSETDFSVIVFKYKGQFSEIMHNPTKERNSGINYYRFRFPKYGFLIKVDQRRFPSGLEPYIIAPNQSLLIRVLEYENSKEYNRILEIRDQIPN